MDGQTSIHPTQITFQKTSLTSFKSKMDGWTTSLSIKSLLLVQENFSMLLNLKENPYAQIWADIPQQPRNSMQYKMKNPLTNFSKDSLPKSQSHFMYLIKRRSSKDYKDEIPTKSRRSSEENEIIFKVNKRNPSCIRKCLSRKILHPAQCHFVC